MALANTAGGVFLKPQTPLQQLLEDINFQRTKEMRQLLKDDSGFVVLQGTTYWTDLFVRHFLFQTEPIHSIDSDDLLFFIRKKHVKSSSRHMPKYETEVDVYRKDSRKLPIGDPDVDWEETVYLNMVIHQFDYTLTLAICTRTSPKELQVLRRHSQRVYASPSRRKMDSKGDGEEMTYPHICFMVDNFDEVFSDIMVRDGEMVCVELVANDKDGAVQGVIFLGSIRYDALKKVYDARQSSLSSKVAQRMSFGLFSSGAGVQTRCEFVRMKGPQGKGHAEMAVTKPKGSGVETPTSEPGFCATDMWDEWEEESDDYYTFRHQRRLSDPSANLNNFTRYSWRTKNPQDSVGCNSRAKARSENEGLDSLASEVSEIEAGDLRDDLHPAFSASSSKLHQSTNYAFYELSSKYNTTNLVSEDNHIVVSSDEDTGRITSSNSKNNSTGCSNCFGSKRGNRWVSSAIEPPEMSEVYCLSCNDVTNESPACLAKMPENQIKTKKNSILNIESELLISKEINAPEKKVNISRSSSLGPTDKKTLRRQERQIKEKPKTKEKENIKDNAKKSLKTASNLLAKVSPKRLQTKLGVDKPKNILKQHKEIIPNNNTSTKKIINTEIKSEEYEIADDAISLNGDELSQSKENAKIAILSETDSKMMITVRGQEELPVIKEPTKTLSLHNENIEIQNKSKCLQVPAAPEYHQMQLGDQKSLGANNKNIDNNKKLEIVVPNDSTPTINGYNGNNNSSNTSLEESVKISKHDFENAFKRSANKFAAQQVFYSRALTLVPRRRTPDGTNIYYWCDLSKKSLKELDDGAFNPLWASRGFTQSFHFWKENKRQQSAPLNAFLTYVTLPWWSIAKDLLDHRESPILTF